MSQVPDSPPNQQQPKPGPSRPSQASSSWWKRILLAQESGLLVVIIALVIGLTIYGAANPKSVRVFDRETGTILRDDTGRPVIREVNRFFEKDNLILITTNASFFAVMAVGMTAVIILAGIDLSVGSIYAVSAILGALALRALGLAESTVWITVPAAIILCCSVGAACGFLNGLTTVLLKVHPFIVTLGTMAIFRGIVLLSTQGLSVNAPASLQEDFFKVELFGINPTLTIIMLAVGLAGLFVLTCTVFGRRVYAIGGNETAARYAGIPVGRIKVTVFTIMGALAGLSACMYIGYFGTASSDAGRAYELYVIAAAVIGGASLSGGRGSAVGAILGAILVELLRNAMIILEIDQNYTDIVIGGAIIAAVVIDQTKARLSGQRH